MTSFIFAHTFFPYISWWTKYSESYFSDDSYFTVSIHYFCTNANESTQGGFLYSKHFKRDSNFLSLFVYFEGIVSFGNYHLKDLCLTSTWDPFVLQLAEWMATIECFSFHCLFCNSLSSRDFGWNNSYYPPSLIINKVKEKVKRIKKKWTKNKKSNFCIWTKLYVNDNGLKRFW